MAEIPYVLTAATEGDYLWLWELKRLTMKPYVEQTWGSWDDELQEDFFRKNFSPHTIQLIMLNGRRAGLLQLEHQSSEIFLANIQIHPDFQNRGLGSAVIRDVLDGAQQLNLPVRLQVLKVNVVAQQLYARLGFISYGESLSHNLLRWWPAGR